MYWAMIKYDKENDTSSAIEELTYKGGAMKAYQYL
jgi:hypothetical protein